MSAVITAKRAALIRQGAVLSNEVKRLQEQLELIKDALQTLDPGSYSVDLTDEISADVLVVEGSRSTLDSKIVKSLLTPAQIAQATKTSDFRSYKFSTKAVVLAEELAA